MTASRGEQLLAESCRGVHGELHGHAGGSWVLVQASVGESKPASLGSLVLGQRAREQANNLGLVGAGPMCRELGLLWGYGLRFGPWAQKGIKIKIIT